MFSKIRASFFTGALVVIPLALTFWVFYFVIDKLNLLLLDPIANILGRWMPAGNIALLVKAAVLLVLLITFALIGFATRIIVLRNVFGFGENILYKVPMVSNIYRTIKEISGAFFVQQKSIFKRVVLLEYPRKGAYQLGFVTSEAKGEVGCRLGKEVLSVFVPTSPNPTSGVLVFVPLEDVIELDMTVAAGMKMVISVGAVAPGNIKYPVTKK